MKDEIMVEKNSYEKIQDTNAITRMFHKTRYRNLVKLVKKFDGPVKIVDIGAGTARAFEALNDTFDIDYVGIEMREDFCIVANSRYENHSNYRMICDSVEHHYEEFYGADMIIALETMEHIPEHLVVRVIEAIANAKPTTCYITVPNEIGLAIAIKNVGSALIGYSRWKEYEWSETFWASLCHLDRVGLHGTDHKGFDWRWLAQTIRHNMKIIRITKSPFQWVPRSISPSIGFVIESRHPASHESSRSMD